MGRPAHASWLWSRLSPASGRGPGDPLSRSRLATVLCVPLTSNLAWEAAPGNTLVPAKAAGLPKDSVANASQLFAIDRTCLSSRTGKLAPKRLQQILVSIDVVLGR